MNRKLIRAFGLAIFLLALRPAWAAEVCCAVVSVDIRAGIVTAKEIKGMKTFEMKVDNAILLRKVRVGDKVDIDARLGKARIEGIAGAWALKGANAAAAAPSGSAAPPPSLTRTPTAAPTPPAPTAAAPAPQPPQAQPPQQASIAPPTAQKPAIASAPAQKPATASPPINQQGAPNVSGAQRPGSSTAATPQLAAAAPSATPQPSAPAPVTSAPPATTSTPQRPTAPPPTQQLPTRSAPPAAPAVASAPQPVTQPPPRETPVRETLVRETPPRQAPAATPPVAAAPSPLAPPVSRGGPASGIAGSIAAGPALPHGSPRDSIPGAQPPAASGPRGAPAGGDDDACCKVTAVDRRSAIVSAEETRSGRDFSIRVDNAIAINRIRVGQAVEADFQANKASVKGIPGRFAIVSSEPARRPGAPTLGPADRTPTARGLPERGGPATDLAAANPSPLDPRGSQRARKTYALPSISAGPMERVGDGKRGRAGPENAALGIRSAPGTKHLRGLDDLDASDLPENAKIVLMMHAGTLPENASDHYIVDTRLAREWAKTHAVPPDMKPKKKKKKKKKKCDLTHSGGCWDKVENAAQDLWDSATEDWRRAWRANTKNLAESWDELQECFTEKTLRLGNIPVRFDIAPEFPVSVEKSGSSSYGAGKSSGNARGTVTLGLPVEADFQAQLEFFYIPCMPFAVRPKSLGADGEMMIAAKLGASLVASGEFKNKYTIPPSGGPDIPVAIIPIVVAGVPVAILEVSLYVEGNIEVGGEGNVDARFQLLAPFKNEFDFDCSGRGCNARNRNVPVPTTTTQNVLVKGSVYVEPSLYTALQLSLNFDALTARAGPEPYLRGEVRGCSATEAMQNTSGQSSLQEYHALSADLDWGIRLRAEALVAGEKVAVYQKKLIHPDKHLWFGDIAPGGSTAMSPGLSGPVTLPVNHAGEFFVASRPCYPYKDAVEYRVTWAGGATQSAGAQPAAGAPRKVAMRPGARSGSSSECSWSAGQGSCTLRPGTDASLHLAWPQPGSYAVTVTPVKDSHGRQFGNDRATQMIVNVQ